ncbi:alpha/beta fold hydrolase, partial [Klebsiella pneumoniae]|uniref:alpha/beta fold hydrolase n=1 Tax=Klebsiella pneumoniae TaxID=573 RepID=UPI0032DCC906
MKLSPNCGSAIEQNSSDSRSTGDLHSGVSFMRAFWLFLFFMFSVPASFAEQHCDAHVPVQRAELGAVSLVYQSVGAQRDPALRLVMGLGGQLIHWPDDVVEALCRQGFRVIRYDNRDVGLSRWNQVPPSANLTVELLRYKLGLPVAAPYTLTDMADDGLRLM